MKLLEDAHLVAAAPKKTHSGDATLRLFLMVRGMKVGSHVNLSPTQVYFFSIKTKPFTVVVKR